MMAAPMTQAVGGAPPPRSAVRGDSTTVSPRGRGSYIWTGPIQNLGATRKLTSETALVRALTLPVGAAPSPRLAVRGASTSVSAWGQASVVVDDSSSIQPRPTPCGCSYNPPCRSPALGAIVRVMQAFRFSAAFSLLSPRPLRERARERGQLASRRSAVSGLTLSPTLPHRGGGSYEADCSTHDALMGK